MDAWFVLGWSERLSFTERTPLETAPLANRGRAMLCLRRLKKVTLTGGGVVPASFFFFSTPYAGCGRAFAAYVLHDLGGIYHSSYSPSCAATPHALAACSAGQTAGGRSQERAVLLVLLLKDGEDLPVPPPPSRVARRIGSGIHHQVVGFTTGPTAPSARTHRRGHLPPTGQPHRAREACAVCRHCRQGARPRAHLVFASSATASASRSL
jgi:hypothetical protein